MKNCVFVFILFVCFSSYSFGVQKDTSAVFIDAGFGTDFGGKTLVIGGSTHGNISLFADICWHYSNSWTIMYSEYSFRAGKYFVDNNQFKVSFSLGISYVNFENKNDFGSPGSGGSISTSFNNLEKSGLMVPLQISCYAFIYRNLGIGFKGNYNSNLIQKYLPKNYYASLCLVCRI